MAPTSRADRLGRHFLARLPQHAQHRNARLTYIVRGVSQRGPGSTRPREGCGYGEALPSGAERAHDDVSAGGGGGVLDDVSTRGRMKPRLGGIWSGNVVSH